MVAEKEQANKILNNLVIRTLPCEGKTVFFFAVNSISAFDKGRNKYGKIDL